MSNIDQNGQYLSFKVDSEVYAINVSQVREILEFNKITKIPNTPSFMRGVINLRGSVVPVVDLKIKFGLEKTEKRVDTCIIVIEIKVDSSTTILGTLADSVSEVFELSDDHIEPAPKIGSSMNNEFIKGVANYNEAFIIILDIDKIFSVNELKLVSKSSKQSKV